MNIKYWKLALSIFSILIIGFIGSFFTADSVNGWYQTLLKPSFNPPNWIFAPVWTLLYVLIGISLYFILVSKASKLEKRNAYLILGIQLALNLAWSILFFGNQLIFGALIDIVALLILIIVNIFVFYKISKLSGVLLVPYLLWVAFATLLNYKIFILNK